MRKWRSVEATRSEQDAAFPRKVAEIIAYLKASRDPIHADAWDTSLENPRLLAERLKDENWPAHVNLFRGMAKARAGFDFSGRRSNPTRWVLAAASFVDLSVENLDHFRASPTVDFDDLYNEGELLSRELGWDISFRQPALLLGLYRDNVVLYSDALKQTQAVAAEARSKALNGLGSPLVDATPRLASADSDAKSLSSFIAMREIRHAGKTSAEWVARSKKSPVVGNENWPSIFHPEKVWSQVLMNDIFLQWEMMGLGRLELTYVAFYSDEKFGGGGGGNVSYETVRYAKPNIEYVLQAKDKSGNAIRLATATVGLKNRVTVSGSGAIYAIQNASLDLQKYLKENDLPFAVPEFSLEAKGLGEHLKQARRIIQTGIRDELIRQLISPTSDLSQALFELDGSARALRGLTVLVFPRSLIANEHLRSILFGRDNADMGQRYTPPLLTSANALDLVRWPDIEKAKREGVADAKGDDIDPTTWPPSVFLRDLEVRMDSSERALLESVESIVMNPSAGPQPQATISEELRRLATLKNLRDNFAQQR
jgi:hypothetical protein